MHADFLTRHVDNALTRGRKRGEGGKWQIVAREVDLNGLMPSDGLTLTEIDILSSHKHGPTCPCVSKILVVVLRYAALGPEAASFQPHFRTNLAY